jgi:hypothetical protein
MVDRARELCTLKRGGGAVKVTLDEAAFVTESRSDELLLDEALGMACSTRARVKSNTLFGGLAIEETAEFCNSRRTVEREWTMARATCRALRGDETG